jgi:hypothetical protein
VLCTCSRYRFPRLRDGSPASLALSGDAHLPLFSHQIRLKTAKLKISSLRLFFDVLSAYLGFINEYCAS